MDRQDGWESLKNKVFLFSSFNIYYPFIGVLWSQKEYSLMIKIIMYIYGSFNFASLSLPC